MSTKSESAHFLSSLFLSSTESATSFLEHSQNSLKLMNFDFEHFQFSIFQLSQCSIGCVHKICSQNMTGTAVRD